VSMRALITNDDGIESPGLFALADAARRAGLDVTVAAPSWDSSGASSALTGVRNDGRLAIESRAVDGLAEPCFALEAAPALIALVAMRGGLGPVPDLVLSGINRGRNTGHAILHSGTVGAVLTGVNHGASGLAVSIDADEPEHFSTAAALATPLICWLAACPSGAAINLNVPNRPADEIAGIRQAPLASIGAVQTNVTDTGQGYVEMTYEAVATPPEPGSDADLLARGWAVVTPLVALTEATGLDLPLRGGSWAPDLCR
jgi:5'-nucleotidase